MLVAPLPADGRGPRRALDPLLEGPDAIRRAVATKAVPLLAEGGCVQLADGRVRATVSLEACRLYRAALGLGEATGGP